MASAGREVKNVGMKSRTSVRREEEEGRGGRRGHSSCGHDSNRRPRPVAAVCQRNFHDAT